MTLFIMKTIPRILILLFALCTMTMMYIARCGLSMDAMMRSGAQVEQIKSEHQREISELKHQLESLKDQMNVMAKQLHNTSKNNVKAFDYELFLAEKLAQSEVCNGISMENEFHLLPFDSFTLNPPRVYLNNPGLGKRVIEMPIGFKRRDLTAAVDTAIDKLNLKQNGQRYSHSHFTEGIFRTVPTSGTQYELYFQSGPDKDTLTKDTLTKDTLTKVLVFQPFAPFKVISTKDVNKKQPLINFIITLSGKLDNFKIFIDHFIKVCILNDKEVFLTVVYFGTDGLNEVKSRLLRLSKRYKFNAMKLINLNETFSRGRGLQVGAQSWKQEDVLLFLCDVDMMFSAGFLQRCRLNAVKGRQVYYPIVFSLYNPHVVYNLHEVPVPNLHEQLVITKETGFWRDFGYGMTCQYLSDFNKLGGFDENINGWGGEDAMLYRKYVKSDLLVIRATDRGLFHLWHEKKCELGLSNDQYNGCIRSKALNEASHSQLGLLAFKDNIDIHRSYMKNKT